VVTGYKDGVEVVRSSASTATFVPGEVVTVTIRLGEAVPPPTDGGMDGGVDASVDAGDAGGGDAGCTSAAACDDGVDCTVDACDDGLCVNTPDDSVCAEGTICDPVEGCPAQACEVDDDCLDSRACNGDETCNASMMCEPGTPVDCSDGDACTDDRCDDAARGCVYTTKDDDGDGFGDVACDEVGGIPATDCNDDSPDIFPGSAEVCNGADDDCNGICDDSFTCCRGELGTCTTSCGTEGTRVCNNSCAWDVCSPPAEVCNGMDDDCNGTADDVFACVMGDTRSCTTSCGSAGTQTCDGTCGWGDCVAPAETCNGVDDDCSGAADDTFDCVAGTTVACTTSCDSIGTQTCDSSSCTLGSCVPPAEGCTGMDDDCDGMIDESVECTAGSTEACTTACGSSGTRTGSAACTFGSCTPPAETCNGVDDDCDGLVDEIFTCVPGTTGTCTTSCSSVGTRTCSASCDWGACVPPIEACNGVDDDCDTMADETFACTAGSSGSCTTSCGTTGSRTCGSSCSWSACSPPAETCNGMDDDCNGACDDGTGMACCAGTTGACTTTCGSTGTRSCTSSCAWESTCTPPAESCSGTDTDCDGMIDEDFECVAGEMQSCTTSCGSTGAQSCSTTTCTFDACNPPTETCNGVDDDCDGTTDEGCGACSACTGSTTVSAPGGRYSVSLGAHSRTGSCGGAGSEAYLTFTLTDASDVFITTHDTGSVDTVLYVRDCTCDGSEIACNDNADGLNTSTLRLTNLSAGTYNVIVDTKAAMSATVSVDVYVSQPGAESDRCGNPTFIPAGTTNISGNTCAFNHDYDITADSIDCQYSRAGDTQDVVYYFYLPTSRSVNFGGCLSGVTVDEVFYIREVCSTPGITNQVACNDDGCGGPPGCGSKYRADLYATLGPGLYYFIMDGWNPDISCDCGDWQAMLSGI